MAHLCAFKRTAEFSPQQVAVWFGGMSMFPDWIINRAVITLGTSTDRFPEFSDVYRLCRREAIQAGLMQERYSAHGTGDEKNTIGAGEIATIGQALDLRVSP